jgi:magnesium transporter
MPEFRVLELDAAANLRASDGADSVVPPAPGVTRWIDLKAQDTESLELLRQRFHLHQLAIEDCAHLDQRPKVEEYGDHIFLVTQGFTFSATNMDRLEVHEVHAFLGERYLVTVHADDIPALEGVWRRVAGDGAALSRGVDFVYYLVADSVVDSNFPILDRIDDELEELEDVVLENPRKSQLHRIFQLKRHLVAMRKVLSPQRDTMAMLARRGDPRVSERTSLYFRDVYDHLSRINESIDAKRDLLGNALDAYLSSVSNRTNDIVKTLTLLSAVFLPLSFVVGFFGQNFHNLVGIHDWMNSDALMTAMIVICLTLPVVMVLWFRHKRWF